MLSDKVAEARAQKWLLKLQIHSQKPKSLNQQQKLQQELLEEEGYQKLPQRRTLKQTSSRLLRLLLILLWPGLVEEAGPLMYKQKLLPNPSKKLIFHQTKWASLGQLNQPRQHQPMKQLKRRQ